MSLSSAINTAQAILSNTSTQISVTSRNIANVNNTDYSRRSAVLASSLGGAQVVRIDRAENTALQKQNLEAIANNSAQSTLVDNLDQLKSILGGNDYETAPVTYIGALRDALQVYASKPGDRTAAESAIAAAGDVASSIRTASASVQAVRKDADSAIADGVAELNRLLERFEGVNNKVIAGSQTGRDVSNELDERDKLLRDISSYVGITTLKRSNNDIVIYTRGGATLFETVPRAVEFEKTTGFAANSTGNAIYIDGVPMEAGSGAATDGKGSLSSLLQIRDEVAPAFQGQLDEIARGLITVFAESDQVSTGADLPGLFTWSGATVPPGGTVVSGIAASLTVNTAVISSQGGNPSLLRDGGINGANYVENTTGAAGFSARLDSLISGFDAPMAFDGSALAGSSGSILSYASGSVGWLELYRSDATASMETKTATLARNNEALSNITGVSLDEEMSLLLELEQSYTASAKLIAAVDEMLRTLLAAVR